MPNSLFTYLPVLCIHLHKTGFLIHGMMIEAGRYRAAVQHTLQKGSCVHGRKEKSCDIACGWGSLCHKGRKEVDIYAAAYLDRETYEEEYFLTVETCTGYIEKNPFVKRIAPHLSVEE